MARPSTQTPDHYILAAALENLEQQKAQLEEKIANVKAMLGGRKSVASVAAPAVEVEKAAPSEEKPKRGRRKRVLSEEARLRIAAAQKKRWAAFRKTGPKS
jgi:hypothetical protein